MKIPPELEPYVEDLRKAFPRLSRQQFRYTLQIMIKRKTWKKYVDARNAMKLETKELPGAETVDKSLTEKNVNKFQAFVNFLLVFCKRLLDFLVGKDGSAKTKT